MAYGIGAAFAVLLNVFGLLLLIGVIANADAEGAEIGARATAVFAGAIAICAMLVLDRLDKIVRYHEQRAEREQKMLEMRRQQARAKSEQ